MALSSREIDRLSAGAVLRCEIKVKIPHNDGIWRAVEYLAFVKKTKDGIVLRTISNGPAQVTLEEEFVKKEMSLVS